MGDLISRRMLLNDKVWLCGGFVGDGYAKGYMEALDKVEEVINAQPTVEAVPVVHGEWEINGVQPNGVIGNFHCSICNGTSLKDSNFCPNCGADMRGENND